MSNKKKGKGKRNQDPKIPRDHFVIGHTAGMVSEFTITIDPSTGVPSIAELDPASLRSQISHAREKKDDKVLYSSPTDGFAALGESFIDQLKKKFDYLIAIDTNTLKDPPRTNGCRVSVCASCAIPGKLSDVSGNVIFEPVAGYLILDPGPDVNNEPLGWHLVIEKLSRISALNSKRIGIIVDSELGLHVDINARKIPYYGEFILPQNMTLIYASSDKPEIFANQMLKHCDHMAELSIADFRKRDPSFMFQVRGTKHGSAICVPINAQSSGVTINYGKPT
jgi:hypothetical protein